MQGCHQKTSDMVQEAHDKLLSMKDIDKESIPDLSPVVKQMTFTDAAVADLLKAPRISNN